MFSQTKMKLILLFLLSLSLVANVSASGRTIWSRREAMFGNHTKLTNNGSVASENEICSNIGVDILKNKGSVVDSAIATSICVNTLNMYSTCLGGGGFMLIHHDRFTHYINFREAAPKNSDPQSYIDDPNSALVGGRAIGVPGMLRGYEVAHKGYGLLPWNQLFAPSIKLAEDGWEASELLADKAKELFESIDKQKNPDMYKEFFSFLKNSNGDIIKKGDIVKRPNYAKALKLIASGGADVFYTGEIANEIVNTVSKFNGTLSLEDLKKYEVKLEYPVAITIKPYQIVTTPLPSSGLVVMSMLKLIEKLKIRDVTRNYEVTKQLVEVFKYGYAQRSHYGDPTNDNKSQINKYIKEFFSNEYINDVVEKIKNTTTAHPTDFYGPLGANSDDKGTAHLSVMDRNGSAVSMTTTINSSFGSYVGVEKYGIILNNEIDDFSIPGNSNLYGYVSSPYNYIEPYKRPMSSMSPLIVCIDGYPILAMGASGGSRIPSSIVNVLANIMYVDMYPYNAVEEPRIHNQLFPDYTYYEGGYDIYVIERMRLNKYNTQVDKASNGVQLVCIYDNLIYGKSDTRKGGVAASY